MAEAGKCMCAERNPKSNSYLICSSIALHCLTLVLLPELLFDFVRHWVATRPQWALPEIEAEAEVLLV